MPSALLTPQTTIAPSSPPRKHWTRAELSAIESAGLLQNQKLELIEGELILKMGKNRPHTVGTWHLLKYLVNAFSIEFVQPEAPIDVHPQDLLSSEPEPDLIVLNCPINSILTKNPKPSEIRLVCEVSDTSLAFDLRTKANLYSRAGIVEYWVLDVNNSRLIVHREPAPEGFRSVQAYGLEESIAPLTAPHAQTLVSTFFS